MKFEKGQVPWNKGISMKSESRLKLSKSLKKAFSNPEAKKRNIEAQKKAWSNPELRKRQSETTRKAMSNIELRKKISESLKGKVPWIKGKHHSEESKKIMSLTKKMLFSEGKIVHPMKGKRHSKDSLKKMSESHKGQVAWNKGISTPKETRKKISEATKKGMVKAKKLGKQIGRKKGIISWNKGKKGIYSKEVLEKLSKSHKKTMSNPEVRKKVSEGLKKRYLSNPEILKKMSEAQKKRLADPRARQKLREATLKQYESGAFPKQTNTKPERMIKEELIKRGYKEGEDFIHQYKFMNKFMCDFCFPDKKVVVEVDGDFWHTNPKKYPAGSFLHPHQLKGIGRDKSKTAYITKVDDGTWALMRFWESDIEKDVSKCVDRIEETLVEKKKI